MWNWELQKLKEGWPIITQHKLLFIIAVSIGATISYFVVDKLYEQSLITKDSTIQSKDNTIANKDDKISDLKDSNESLKTELEQLKNKKVATLEEPYPNWEEKIKKPIIGKTFQNERVELDGFSYIKCKFINVKFVYKGEAPFDMVDPVFVGTHGFDVSSNRPISGLVKFLEAMGHTKNLKFHQIDTTKND